MLDILQAILSLVVIQGERSYPSGTASIVGRRLAMTAKHVIDDYLNQFSAAGSADEFLGADVFGLQYQAADDSGVRSIARWIRVVKIWRSPLTDIAFLELDTEFPRRLPLSVLPTEVGHRTRAIGFHQSRAGVVSSKAVELPESVRAKLYTHTRRTGSGLRRT